VAPGATAIVAGDLREPFEGARERALRCALCVQLADKDSAARHAARCTPQELVLLAERQIVQDVDQQQGVDFALGEFEQIECFELGIPVRGALREVHLARVRVETSELCHAPQFPQEQAELTAPRRGVQDPPELAGERGQESSERVGVEFGSDVDALAERCTAIALDGTLQSGFVAHLLVILDGRKSATLACNQVRDPAASRRQRRAYDDTAERGLQSKPQDAGLFRASQAEPSMMPRAQERSDLDLQGNQERCQQWIGDVGHQVGQHQIQAQGQANQNTEHEVKAVHGQATDEQAERNGERDACG